MSDHHRLLDLSAGLSAAFAVVSLANAALVLTIIATCLSISLALLRWHDRIRYGPRP